MENTPTGHADDLPTILGIFKNDPKSRSVGGARGISSKYLENRPLFSKYLEKRPIHIFLNDTSHFFQITIIYRGMQVTRTVGLTVLERLKRTVGAGG